MGSHEQQPQQQFCLRWNNHQMNLLSVFEQLLQNEAFVDVTLACDGLSIKAHKVVLSACSPYFQRLLLDNPCQHPIVILNDVQYEDLKALVDFMYKGEVSVNQNQLSALLRTAENLKVRGLAEMTAPPASDHPSATRSADDDMTATVVAPPSASSSSGDADVHANPCGSPTAKRKRLRPRRKSGTTDETGTGAATNVVVTLDNSNCSPTDAAINKDGDVNGQQHALSTEAAAAASSSASKSHDVTADCLLEARVHEGFSQDEEGQGSSMDPLGLSQYTTPNSNQHHHHQQQQQQQQQSYQYGHHQSLTHGQPSSSNTSSAHLQPQDTASNNGAVNNNNNNGNVQIVNLQSQHEVPNKACELEPSRGNDHWTTVTGSVVDVNHAIEAALRHHQQQQQQQQSQSRSSGRHIAVATSPYNSVSMCAITPTTWSSAVPSTTSSRHGGNQSVTRRETDNASSSSLALLAAIPKREYSLSASSNTSGWTEDSLAQALDAIRSGRMSITKAAVTYGIPNTTLWQRTRREGIDTSRNGSGGSCHQAATGWTETNLAQALEAVRSGRMSVNRASTTYGIPSTTLWSRAKRYGIETHRRLPGGGSGTGAAYEPHERDEVMWHALQAVKAGVISMTQASIKYNLPYTTLWKHFKKWEIAGGPLTIPLSMSHSVVPSIPSSAAMVMAGGLHHHHHHHGHLGGSGSAVATAAAHSHPIDSIIGGEQTTST